MPAAPARRYDPNRRYLLNIDPGSVQHINFDHFWPATPGVNIDPDKDGFFWQVLVRYTYGGYVLSDGVGGAHNILLGRPTMPGPMTGNLWDGSGTVGFGSGYSASLGEWVLEGLLWTGSVLWSYANGVTVGVREWTGNRINPGAGDGAGCLFVGGSDHINMGGQIAMIQAWDTVNPWPAGSNYGKGYKPSLFPGFFSDTGIPCDFYPELCTGSPGGIIRDLSPRGRIVPGSDPADYRHHHGFGFGAQGGVINLGSFYEVATGQPGPPIWVPDDGGCPLYRYKGTFPRPTQVLPAAPSTPPGVRAYDSFTRVNNTYLTDETVSLGQTEAGSQGQLTWAGMPGWGILGSTARYLEGGSGVVYVDIGTATQNIGVRRDPSSPDTPLSEVGLCWRVVDNNNHWRAYAERISAAPNGTVYVGYVEAANWVQVAAIDPGTTSWDWLRIDHNGTTLKIYRGSGASWATAVWTQIGSDITGTSKFTTATKAGLAATVTSGAQSSLATYLEWVAA